MPAADDTVTVPVALSREEHRDLKVRAAQSDTTMGDLVRLALAAAGLLAREE